MTLLRVLLAVLLLDATAAFASDKTDLYYIPAESGWGMTVANQADTIFVTMYVYDSARQPTWFVGTGLLQSTDSQGVNTYGGDWYSVTGPYYGAATFDPSTVNATKVGTYTYREVSVTTGQITYSVNGTSVTKTAQRQTLANNTKVNGTFGGAYFSTMFACDDPTLNGNPNYFLNLLVAGAPGPTRVTLINQSTGVTCNATGLYSQSGRMGSVSGTMSCSNGFTGRILLFEIEAGTNAISARFNVNYNNGCAESGHFAAARASASS
jgi:hypothetical protein